MPVMFPDPCTTTNQEGRLLLVDPSQLPAEHVDDLLDALGAERSSPFHQLTAGEAVSIRAHQESPFTTSAKEVLPSHRRILYRHLM